ncbi:MAG: hypothetical protein Q9184_001886 [Pyrenodesmia sp. 2 TL-2023]
MSVSDASSSSSGSSSSGASPISDTCYTFAPPSWSSESSDSDDGSPEQPNLDSDSQLSSNQREDDAMSPVHRTAATQHQTTQGDPKWTEWRGSLLPSPDSSAASSGNGSARRSVNEVDPPSYVNDDCPSCAGNLDAADDDGQDDDDDASTTSSALNGSQPPPSMSTFRSSVSSASSQSSNLSSASDLLGLESSQDFVGSFEPTFQDHWRRNLDQLRTGEEVKRHRQLKVEILQERRSDLHRAHARVSKELSEISRRRERVSMKLGREQVKLVRRRKEEVALIRSMKRYLDEEERKRL